MNPIDFFTSADVTLSDKLLEIFYAVNGIVALYAAWKNLRDEGNEHRYGSALFWGLLGMLFIAGPWLPAELVGVLVVVMVIPPILKRVSPGSDRDPSDAEMEAGYRSIGMKIFVPALCIGIFALAFALFTPISSLVGIGVGVLAAALILMAYSRKNKPRVRVRSWYAMSSRAVSSEFAVRARTVERAPRELTGCSVRGRSSLAVKWAPSEFTALFETGSRRGIRPCRTARILV